MDGAVENLIKYFMTIAGAGALIWKFIDAWEKRKSVTVKELEDRIRRSEECCTELREEVKGIKSNAANTLEIVLGWFKK